MIAKLKSFSLLYTTAEEAYSHYQTLTQPQATGSLGEGGPGSQLQEAAYVMVKQLQVQL